MSEAPLHVKAMLSLRGEDHRVWAYIHWRQGGNGSAWPSQETIAADLGLTVQGVRNITRRLQEKGWLKIETPDTGGRSHGLHYAVCEPEKPSTTVEGSKPEKVNDGLPLAPPEGSTGVYPSDEKGSTTVEGSEAEGSTAVEEKGQPPFTRILTRRPTLRPKEIFRGDSEPYRLAELLLAKIRDRDPKAKANLQQWAADIDRLIRLDERSPNEVHAVILWCQAEAFWQDNILSANKLRKNYEQLYLKMQKGGNTNGKAQRNEQASDRAGGNGQERHGDEDRPSGGGLVFQNKPPVRKLREPAAVG